jgi:hypothetical protein
MDCMWHGATCIVSFVQRLAVRRLIGCVCMHAMQGLRHASLAHGGRVFNIKCSGFIAHGVDELACCMMLGAGGGLWDKCTQAGMRVAL